MHRPKKKKNRDPLLPETSEVDERHLIDAEDSAEISIEDRISMYWMENKGFITGCITILALAIITLNGMRIYKDHAEQKLQAAYAEARTNGSLADFAKAHPNKDLGGFAALVTADQAYETADFATATEFYGIAAKALKESILAGRAQLGQAFALYSNGSNAEALAQLNSIAANSSLAEAVRAEAAYHLAVEADKAGRTEEFDRYLAQITDSPLARQWQQRLDIYLQQVH